MWSRWLILGVAGWAAGCGFRLVPDAGGDAGAGGAWPASAAFGVDAGAPPDLRTPGAANAATDAGGGAAADGAAARLGPGPLGALPAGFCCVSDDECRSRHCDVALLGHKICIESCVSNADCTHYSDQFFCFPDYHLCSQKSELTACIPPYERGDKPTGACCNPNAANPGQECAGGWCITSGATDNPYYCTQGCKADADCPAGYACDQPNAQCRRVDVVFSCTS